MAKRVFELARELGVTSKVILEKCRAESVELKNHMATLSAGLEATITEWFSEGANVSAIEQTEHVDLEKAREDARKQRRRRSKEQPAPAEAEAPAAEAAVAEAPGTEAAEAPAEAAAVEVPPVPAETPAEEAPAAVAEAPAAEPAEAPEVAAEPAPEEARPKEPVKAAGPQLVPRPARLRGPRVVRVTTPDYLPTPRPARRPATPPPAVPSQPVPGKPGKQAVPATEEDAEARKTKRRTPRRRGDGTVAEVGEKLREWRDQDLLERSAGLAAAGVGLRRHRAALSPKHLEGAPGARAGKVEIEEPITVRTFSAATGIKAANLIKKLLEHGTAVTVNQVLSKEMAETLAMDYSIELQVKEAKTAEEELVERLESRPAGEKVVRAPVVTFMGHVDHGKTSLLDRIRGEAVATGEAGGITQHMGAYRYDKGDKHVVFLDTPGHEAFTAMRARGANMTDVVVLVVAADDGVMPQTVEALSHAKAAEVPIVVALNKIDLPSANVPRALGQLSEHGLQPREWGGPVEVIRTSAVSGEGIDTLVETLSLEAELLELKAETEAPASGFVIEANVDPGLGAMVKLLVLNGTLRVGEVVLAGRSFGRVRQIFDYRGRSIDAAGPASPVAVAGMDELPEAGDRFYVAGSLEEARAAALDCRQRTRIQELVTTRRRSLQDLLQQIEAGETNELALIVKADVHGSIEALTSSLEKLGTDEVKVRILHAAVGGVTVGDVTLAEASNAIILGFNVVPDASARALAEMHGVDIRLYRIIYNVIEDVRKALEEGLAPEIRQETLGRAEVRQVFKISRLGTVAGCYVTDGLASRSAKIRLIRDNVVVADERTLESLRRFKDDVREVRAGMECGLKIAGYDDLKERDVLEFYRQVEVARTL